MNVVDLMQQNCLFSAASKLPEVSQWPENGKDDYDEWFCGRMMLHAVTGLWATAELENWTQSVTKVGPGPALEWTADKYTKQHILQML